MPNSNSGYPYHVSGAHKAWNVFVIALKILITVYYKQIIEIIAIPEKSGTKTCKMHQQHVVSIHQVHCVLYVNVYIIE